MTSNWALPTTISQYSEEEAEQAHISWQEVNNFSALKALDGRNVKTTTDLVHIARDPRHDIVQKTYYLKLTGFNLVDVPDTVSGIEARLTMNRYGRITDETVQLCLNDVLIGENRATLDLSPKKTYGGDNDTWEAVITKSNVLNPSFGVVLRFQSHPRWPHKSSALIDSVEIRVY